MSSINQRKQQQRAPPPPQKSSSQKPPPPPDTKISVQRACEMLSHRLCLLEKNVGKGEVPTDLLTRLTALEEQKSGCNSEFLDDDLVQSLIARITAVEKKMGELNAKMLAELKKINSKILTADLRMSEFDVKLSALEIKGGGEEEDALIDMTPEAEVELQEE